MKRIKPYLPALTIFCLALLVRVIYNSTVAGPYYPLHDSLFYQTIGINFIQHGCFCLQTNITTVYRAPLWPIILGIFSLFFGNNSLPGRLFLCVLDAGTCVLIYLFARDLFGRRFGMGAGLIAVIYPNLLIYTGWLYSETLFTFLLFALCYTLYRLQRANGETKRLWPLCGVLLGLLSLTRPDGILVIALFVLWAIFLMLRKVLPRPVTLRGAALATLLGLAIIAPWTVRNYAVAHAFIPVATGDGTVLLGAYNEDTLNPDLNHGEFLGTWVNPLTSVPQVSHQFPTLTCQATCEVRREAAYNHAARQWMLAHPQQTLQLWMLHFINMWRPDAIEADLPVYRFPNAPLSGFVLGMMQTVPIAVLLLASFGLAVTFFRWRELLFMYLMIGMTFALGIYFYAIPRFRTPIEPMIILLAAGAIWWVVNAFRRRTLQKPQSPPPVREAAATGYRG
jgi:4-amino-4-deoxy-L-arabinose transferase-like glycosyltransferase